MNGVPARWRSGLASLGIAVLLASAACSNAPTTASASDGRSVPSAAESDAPVATHLKALQKIADEHGGNRAAGTPGYDASVDYVQGVLQRAGFDVSTPTYEASEDDRGAQQGRNVVAQTRTGDGSRVVMIGAHLDSVPKGPGIADNGSGVAALLEIATRLGADPQVKNAVRFAFFGHEETGSQGSAGYLRGLPPDEVRKIELYLNVDMVASSNGGYFVQGGQGSDPETAGPPGSATVAQVLADQLASTGVKPEIIEFVGDDETPFIAAGIPVGGAENGDKKRKTDEQAAAWGGKAGEAYDRCYHQSCDRIENVNLEVLDHYQRALDATIVHFASSTDALR
jgi:aminopeptidase S